ncbi:hypothetical protein H6776_02695 [Candidatus Nomurabacteria bacterium]|nr:hypothetical protein [Candidatus Nomurabacteria bacterium]
MENFPKPVNKQEQKEEIKNLEGIDFVFEQYPEIKQIAQESLEPSFEDKKRIFEMLRSNLIDSVRDVEDYEKYNGNTLAVKDFSEDSYKLLLQGLEEKNIDVQPRLNKLKKDLEEINLTNVMPEGADVMDYFNPATGEFSVYNSKEEKDSFLKNTEHDIELLKYLENKDEKAKEIYEKYLETIFLQSQIKDIVYHGGPEGIEKFDKNAKSCDNIENKSKGRFFTGIYNLAKVYAEKAQIIHGHSQIYPVIVNITNPITVTDKLKLDEELYPNNDSIIHESSLQTDKFEELVVFETDQIHILGSKKDQEMFKEFLNKNEGELSKLELPPISIVENPTELQKKIKGSMSSMDFNIESGNDEIGTFTLNVMGRPGEEGYGYFNTIKLEEEFRGKDYGKSVYLQVIKKLKEDNKKLSTEWTLTKGADAVWQWLVENGYARVKQEGERNEENKGAGYSTYQYESLIEAK